MFKVKGPALAPSSPHRVTGTSSVAVTGGAGISSYLTLPKTYFT